MNEINNTPNTATVNVNVIATTELWSNSGRVYPYALQLEVNPATGRVRVTAETECRVCVRPYQLLHLMVKVIRAVNPALIEGKEVALVVKNPANHGSHLAMECRGKRYRLDHEVGASWVQNPALLSMVRALESLRKKARECKLSYLLDYSQYRILNLDNPHPWEVWIQ